MEEVKAEETNGQKKMKRARTSTTTTSSDNEEGVGKKYVRFMDQVLQRKAEELGVDADAQKQDPRTTYITNSLHKYLTEYFKRNYQLCENSLKLLEDARSYISATASLVQVILVSRASTSVFYIERSAVTRSDERLFRIVEKLPTNIPGSRHFLRALVKWMFEANGDTDTQYDEDYIASELMGEVNDADPALLEALQDIAQKFYECKVTPSNCEKYTGRSIGRSFLFKMTD